MLVQGLKFQAWFDIGDIQNLLCAAEVVTDKGAPWTKNECRVWMQAVGEWHDGTYMVRRERLWETFPEVFARLCMARAAGAAGLDELRALRYLYAVELVDVGVKYGYSATPRARVTHHIQAARAHGRSVGRLWASDKHAGAIRNEATMKARYGRREYLPDANFDAVVQELRALPGVGQGTLAATPADISALPEDSWRTP